MSATTESLDYLVLDAGAIIRGHGLNLFKNTKTIVTVPEVIAEIRDSKARDLLNSLPFEIEERVPSTDSFKAVIEFAKKTGDFAALSKTDLKVIALSYMLEIEIHGSIAEKTSKIGNAATDIRMIHAAKQNSNATAESTHVFGDNDTGMSVEQASVVAAITDLESTVCDLSLEDKFGVQSTEQAEHPTGEAHHNEDAQAVENAALPTTKPAFSWANMVKSGNTKPVAYVAPVVQPKTIPRNVVVVGDVETVEALTAALPEETRASQQQSQSNIITRQSDLGSTKAESQRLAIEDDGVGWINASNLTSHLSISGGQLGVRSTDNAPTKSKKKKTAKRAVRVACVTTDFSMQNVLMQIGLNIMSVDGLLIRSVKQWVLRCMGCYQVHYDMDRLFCVKCGTNHLSRVSASIDSETGVLKLHLKKNYQNDTRGTKYSLPAPGKQDRYSGELLLREDQLLSGIWRQKCVKIRKDIKSVFGEDVTSDVGLHINKSQSIKVGLGQRNPNATKGRERRGKAKK